MLDTDTEGLTPTLAAGVALPCGLRACDCPALRRLLTAAAGVAGAAGCVAGAAAEPVTATLDIGCARGPGLACRLAVAFAAGRLVVTDATPGAMRRLH